MAAGSGAKDGLIEPAARFIINSLYWASPYRWVDEWQKRVEEKVKGERGDWNRIRNRRYLLSELYILGWLGLAGLLLPLNQLLPTILAFLLVLRVAGILNKELGVVLFGICKITEGEKVSASARVILLALSNYLTAGLLFALLYCKVGIYQLDTSATSSPLPVNYAIVQSLSVLFTLGPAYAPLDLQTRLLTIVQSGFCFLYGILIIASFVSLVNLKATNTQ